MGYFSVIQKIIDDYPQYSFIFAVGNKSYCFIGVPIIIMRKEIQKHATADDVFDMLHEIGHLETNKKYMQRYKKEFLATQWAIQQCKTYKLTVSNCCQKRYDDYIEKWRVTSIKYHGKNVWSKEKCKLNWDFN